MVLVDGIDEEDRRKQQEKATESINRIMNRSDDDEMTNVNKEKDKRKAKAGINETKGRGKEGVEKAKGDNLV